MDYDKQVAELQGSLSDAGLAGAVLSWSRDVYYYTGVATPAWLMARPDDYRLFLRRGAEHARAACGLDPACLREESRLTRACAAMFPGAGAGEKIGAELDILNLGEAAALQRALGGRELSDLTPLVLAQRMVKEPGEVAAVEAACAATAAGHRAALAALRPGLTELELAAAIEHAQRLAGHQGVYFFRQTDVLMANGPVASGPDVARMTGTVFTATGVGLHPSLPAGPSRRALAPGELALTDIPACVEGYHADQTRMYALASAPAAAWEMCGGLRELSDALMAALRPGMTCVQACALADELARAAGLGGNFQRFPGGAKAHYIGHGVGLELNEPPVISTRNPTRLAAGMTLALELHLNGPEGLFVKLEDTVHLEAGGARLLTGPGRGLNEAG